MAASSTFSTGTEVPRYSHGDAALLEAAVLDVDDLAHADRVLVLAHGGRRRTLRPCSVHEGADLLVGEQRLGLRRDDERRRVDGDVEPALDLDAACPRPGA